MNTTTTPQSVTIPEGYEADLRKVYLTIYDAFAFSPADVRLEVNGNKKYARELTALLEKGGLIALSDVNGEDEVWQTYPDSYDTMDRDEAERRIDEFLGDPKDLAPAAEKPEVTAEGSPCKCGCGEATGKKSNYRPGHDARHAGNVGRAIASASNEPGFDRRVLLDTLPTDALKAKAEGVAATAQAKIDKQHARAAAKAAEKAVMDAPAWVEGTAKVGKTEVLARRYKDGHVDVLVGTDDWKAASKTAAKTFRTEV